MSIRKEKRKEAILDAAFSLFMERGYTGVKIIDIANAAGIGKGTVYEYFNSKESILLELIDTKVKRAYACFWEESRRENLSCRDKLSRFVAFEAKMASQFNWQVTDFKRRLLSDFNDIAPEVADELRNIVLLHFDRIHQIIREGVKSGEFREIDPHVATACFLGAVCFYLSMSRVDDLPFGCLGFQPFQRENLPLEGEQSVLDLFFRGLLPPGAAENENER